MKHICIIHNIFKIVQANFSFLPLWCFLRELHFQISVFLHVNYVNDMMQFKNTNHDCPS